MKRIGIFGVGHLGRIHLRCLQATPFEVVGFFDPDIEAAKSIQEAFGIRRFDDMHDLFAHCDAVDIVSPTQTHFVIAEKALRYGKHVFIEKPICSTVAEARKLRDLAIANSCLIQVGHVERFNPVFSAIPANAIRPKFIESHRLSPFSLRGTDVSVVLDLMIHDIDLCLTLVRSEIEHISASGVPVLSEQADICNARLEFANGCVANLTASRISLKQMRKFRIFQEDAYISLDFLEKKAQWVRLRDAIDGEDSGIQWTVGQRERRLEISEPAIEDHNAIVEELQHFFRAIRHGERPLVGVTDGINALEVAEQINAEIQKRLSKQAHD